MNFCPSFTNMSFVMWSSISLALKNKFLFCFLLIFPFLWLNVGKNRAEIGSFSKHGVIFILRQCWGILGEVKCWQKWEIRLSANMGLYWDTNNVGKNGAKIFSSAIYLSQISFSMAVILWYCHIYNCGIADRLSSSLPILYGVARELWSGRTLIGG